MTPERWQQVKGALNELLELEPEPRSERLRDIATTDPDLRRELDSLLAAHEEAGEDFLSGSAVESLGLEGFAADPLIGHRLGPYQIVERLGHGGMGEVYRAFRADDQYRKEVAIKLVRYGQDSAPVVARFKQERQILAGLDHPNIARLLDGGTTDRGVPYFVMELIQGEPIDDYCKAHDLPTHARLKLFLDVCSAVQYAHQRLIIHRDIKPGNILVTSEGVPKLLDFGIAKILESGGEQAANTTRTQFRALTPEYASPEQVRGQPITTSSDVYSLGVVLYELLTGRSPYKLDSTDPLEISKAICDEQPQKPSTVAQRAEAVGQQAAKSPQTKHRGLTTEVSDDTFLGPAPGPDHSSAIRISKSLRGDLDNIVLMALRKEPQRRYVSVEQFAEDIRRHVANLPVIARKDTLGYRTSKFIRRNKVGVAASAAVAAALIAGMAVTLHEARVARTERARAERRFNDVRELANSLMFDIHDSIKDLPGSTPARKLLVGRALQYLDSLSQEAGNDRSLQIELASAYEKIGDVQGLPLQGNLGDPNGAVASYKKALAIREPIAAANPKDLEIRRQLVPNYGKLSDMMWSSGNSKSSLDYSSKAVVIAREVYRSNPSDPANELLYARDLLDHGFKVGGIGHDRTTGIAELEEGAALLEKISAEQPSNTNAPRLLALAYFRTANILQDNKNDFPAARDFYEKAIAATRAMIAQNPDNADLRRMIAYDHYSIAQLDTELGQTSSALSEDGQALPVFESLAAADPHNAQYQIDVGEIHNHIAVLDENNRDESGAIQNWTTSFETLEKLPDSKNPQSMSGSVLLDDEFRIANAHMLLAFAPHAAPAIRNSECSLARSWFDRALPVYQQLHDANPQNSFSSTRLNQTQSALARCTAK
jgi:eukaryotic-like serine/threonine-protein kinase